MNSPIPYEDREDSDQPARRVFRSVRGPLRVCADVAQLVEHNLAKDTPALFDGFERGHRYGPGAGLFSCLATLGDPPCATSRTCNQLRTSALIRGKLCHPRVTHVTKEKHPSGVPVRDNVLVSGQSEQPVTLPSTISKTSPTVSIKPRAPQIRPRRGGWEALGCGLPRRECLK